MAKKATANPGFGLASNISENPPSSPRPLRRISQDTAESLELLSAQIAAAEKHLQKMPASSEPTVVIELSDVLGVEPDAYHGIEYYLEFNDGTLSVVTGQHCGGEFNVQKRNRIADYPTTTRIAIANRIPDLIRRAKEAETGIKASSDAAVAAIQKAIDESMEAYE